MEDKEDQDHRTYDPNCDYEVRFVQLQQIAKLNALGQDKDTFNRSSLMNTRGPEPIVTVPQLPLLALKPDRLLFSMSTADLQIWKEDFFSRCLLREERGRSEAESSVDIVCTASWEGIL